jgi:hypothetical protein
MADTEQKEEGSEGVVNTEATSTEEGGGASQPQYTEVEQRAMAQGWVPEDQYEGAGKWRDAEQFLDRGELFSKIDDLKRRNISLEGTVQEVKRHYQKIAAGEYQRALANLRSAKKEALDEGDSEKVVQIDEAISNTKVAASQEMARLNAPAQMPAAQDPVFMVWENRNPWYSQDRAMKIYADTVAEELVHRGMNNPTQLLAETERRVKSEFSHKFNNPNRAKPGTVEGGGSRGTGTKDTFQLTPEETQVMNKFVKHKVMTKDEYIKEIKAQRGGR